MSEFQPAAFHRFGAVSVRLSVELGRTEMQLRDVLRLGEGSTVTLDRLTDELLDVTANGRVIARGEVVADKGRFALRIVSLVDEDGQELPPTGQTRAPAEAGATGAMPAPRGAEDWTGQAARSSEPVDVPAPPADPLMSALDDLL